MWNLFTILSTGERRRRKKIVSTIRTPYNLKIKIKKKLPRSNLKKFVDRLYEKEFFFLVEPQKKKKSKFVFHNSCDPLIE